MTTFDSAANFVLKYEGGLTDHPADAGGLTKFGISQRQYPLLNISKLTEAEARDIYKRDFWDRCNCGTLPPALGFLLFESAVNQGPMTAIRTLQRALQVRADGVIGPTTITAAQTRPIQSTIADFIARLALRYAILPMLGTFGLGWFRRLAAAHQAALRLIEQQAEAQAPREEAQT